MRISGGARNDEVEIRRALLEVFGAKQALLIENVPHFDGKVVQYTSGLVATT